MVVLEADLEVEKMGWKMDWLKAALKVLQKETKWLRGWEIRRDYERLFRGRRFRPPTGMTSWLVKRLASRLQ